MKLRWGWFLPALVLAANGLGVVYAQDDAPEEPPAAEEPGDDAEEPGVDEGEEPKRPGGFSQRVLTDSQSFISDAVRGPDRTGVPGGRPYPFLEIGDPFLGQGPLNEGFTLPGGAVWNPSLLVYGTYRTAVQVFDNGLDRAGPGVKRIKPSSEWANRLDIFANLRLSATERVVFGMRPYDDLRKRRRGYTGYEFEPNRTAGVDHEIDDWNDGTNGRISTLFFEGDFGELFPNLDLEDGSLLDIGFSIGRQNLLFQDGVMINGTMDAIGLTRNSLRFLPYSSNTRITALYANPDLVQTKSPNNDPLTFSATDQELLQVIKSGRFRRNRDQERDMAALLTATDFSFTTMELDVAYVNQRNNGSSGIFVGAGFHQRIGHLNTTFRWNMSHALGRKRIDGPQDGHLLNVEISLDVPKTHPLIPDVVYLNAFLGIDRYRSAYRGADTPTPLARVGITYAGRGLGRYGTIMGDQVTNDFNSNSTGVNRLNPLRFADRAAGFALGYQMFLFGDVRKQIIVEVSGRRSTVTHRHNAAGAVGVRYQQAFWEHFILLVEGFGGKTEGMVEAFGSRIEIIAKF